VARSLSCTLQHSEANAGELVGWLRQVDRITVDGVNSIASCPQYHIWYTELQMAWTVETLNETVDVELSELPTDMRARLVRISELIVAACPT
jgi:hypothetical protein